MICPVCKVAIADTTRDGVAVVSCPSCHGLWVTERQLEEIKDREDRFLRWLDLDLWKDIEDHEIGVSEKSCPSCGERLHSIEHSDIGVVIEVCVRCRAVWLDPGELEAIIGYLEDRVDNETVSEYLRELGHEAVGLVKGEKPLPEEMKDIATVFKLLEYRVFSRLPILSGIVGRLPR